MELGMSIRYADTYWIVTKYKLSNFGKEIYILDLLFRDAKRHVDIFFVQYQN